ncbi:MAG: hypothetical protein P8N43_14805, partial [Alphaproteobacteria bacterium]|nr:hypothetical protein [Alphaproteobacteria bacterium]
MDVLFEGLGIRTTTQEICVAFQLEHDKVIEELAASESDFVYLSMPSTFPLAWDTPRILRLKKVAGKDCIQAEIDNDHIGYDGIMSFLKCLNSIEAVGKNIVVAIEKIETYTRVDVYDLEPCYGGCENCEGEGEVDGVDCEDCIFGPSEDEFNIICFEAL